MIIGLMIFMYIHGTNHSLHVIHVTHVFKIFARVEYLLPQLKVLILTPLIVLLAEEICLSNVLQTEKK